MSAMDNGVLVALVGAAGGALGIALGKAWDYASARRDARAKDVTAAAEMEKAAAAKQAANAAETTAEAAETTAMTALIKELATAGHTSNEEVRALLKELRESHNVIASNQQAILDLNQTVDNLRREVGALRNELTEEKERNENVNAELVRTKDEVIRLTRENAAVRTENAELEGGLVAAHTLWLGAAGKQHFSEEVLMIAEQRLDEVVFRQKEKKANGNGGNGHNGGLHTESPA